MGDLFSIVLTTSIYACVVGIVILFIKAVLKNKLSPGWHYAIWIVLILKLLIPFGPESAISLFNRLPTQTINLRTNDTSSQAIQQQIEFQDNNTNINYGMPVKSDIDKEHKISAAVILPYIWFSGTVIMLLWLIYTNCSMYRKLKLAQNVGDTRIKDILKNCLNMAGINRDIEIVFQDIITTPSLFGAIKPKILLPPSILNFSDRDISYIFLHELAHYKRKDVLANYLLLVFQSIHWFNPVIWLCFRKIRQDMEAAADEKVLSILNIGEHKEYGMALIKVLESIEYPRLAPRLIGMIDDKKNMERRIKMIKMAEFFKNKRLIIFITGFLCIIILSGILLTRGVSGDIVSSAQTTDKAGTMYKCKTSYVGDNTKVVNLVNTLNYSEFRRDVSLKTKEKPYGVDINYDFSLVDMEASTIELNFYKNAAIMFSLIDNADIINFHIKGGSGQPDYSYKREDMQKNFDKSFKEYGKDINSLRNFLNILSLKIYVFPQKYSPAMSMTPGIRILADYDGPYTAVKYSTESGNLLTWDRSTGKIKYIGKTAEISKGLPVYWSALDESGKLADSGTGTAVVKVAIMNNINIMIDGQVSIKGGASTLYEVQPSRQVVIGQERKNQNPKNLDEAVGNAIKGQSHIYRAGEVSTEGHIILDTEEKDGKVKVYTLSSFAAFGFENGIFTVVSGSGAIPTVITFSKDNNDGYLLEEYKEPMDGSYYVSSIKKMFPQKLWNKVLKSGTSHPEIKKQQEEQAAAYLKSIGREAKVSTDHVDKKLPQINVDASNKLFSEFTKYDQELNSFPYWIGTQEQIDNGTRYIYETSQGKTADGLDLIVFAKKKEDGTLVKEYKYKIVGSEPQLIQ